MEFKYGVPGNTGSRGGFKGKNITSYLKEALQEQDQETGQPKNKLIAQRLVEMALDKKIPARDFLALAHEILNRLEGKALETTVNANIDVNPFADIPTDMLIQIQEKMEKAQAEIKAEQAKALVKPE